MRMITSVVHKIGKHIDTTTSGTAIRSPRKTPNGELQCTQSYISLLQDCANTKALEAGKRAHSRILVNGAEQNNSVETKLLTMYAKCGNLVSARLVFDRIIGPDLFLWASMIGGYARYEQFEEALKLYYQMQDTGIQPDNFIFPSVLKACAGLPNLRRGEEVHGYIIRTGYELDIFVGSALVDMYAKCGKMEDARQLFDKMSQRDVVSWVAMIGGYAQNGRDSEALEVFRQMQYAGVKPNMITIVSVLPACARLSGLEQGKELHDYIIRRGFESHVFVGSALVDMYAKCGSIEDARRAFDKISERDVVSWNAMVAGYSQNGCEDEALKLFRLMQLSNMKPNSITIASVLSGCAHLEALQQGKEIHDYVIRNGFHSDVFVANSLVDMYAKSGSLMSARTVFDKMSQRDVVSWNTMIACYAQSGCSDEAFQLFSQMQVTSIKPNIITWNSMIAGYVQNGHGDEALEHFYQMQLAGINPNIISWNAIIAGYAQNGNGSKALKLFCQMQQAGMKPNSVTIASVLPACANLAALQHGKEIHEFTIRNGFELDVFVGSALVDMYAKCGIVEVARQVFDRMSERDMVLWNAMISGYAMHGNGEDAVVLFDQMLQEGVKPDHVTFTGVLSACSHAGLVDAGWQYFNAMGQDYSIQWRVEHYACMVDLLGRAGCLNEACDLIDKMPLEPSASVWGALLGACRIHCNIQLGERAAEHLFEMDPENVGNYVLLSNIYASSARWDDVAKVRKMLKDKRLKKRPGCSWIEVNNRLHTFLVGDRSHPRREEIYTMLETLAGQIKEAGYVPDGGFALHDVDEEEKEHILCGHSEKLAIAFGLISSCPGTPIRIFKNLRMCGDCHTVTKHISKIVKREIMVRDANRFHHFKDGLCNCGDYW